MEKINSGENTKVRLVDRVGNLFAKKEETIEQKQEKVIEWVEDISEKQEVKEISANVLREVLEIYGADFENLTEENNEQLSMYAEKERVKALKVVWGEKFKEYKVFINDFILDYERRTDKELPKMKNIQETKNPNRVPSERKDKGMLAFLGDLTAYASGNLSFESFQLFLQTRAENGLVHELSSSERQGRKSKRIWWDRELEKKENYETVQPLKDPEKEGEFLPIYMQSIRPASFPPEYPKAAFDWLKTNK